MHAAVLRRDAVANMVRTAVPIVSNGATVTLLRRDKLSPSRSTGVVRGLGQVATAPQGKIRFGCCVLDDGRGTLSAPDGAETVLRPKTLDLLRLMLRNPGRVVSRQEILDAVWPNLFVTDDSITQCVVEIRRAMGAGGVELLKTVPRRGYLLQAEVAAEPPKNGRANGLLGAAPAQPEDRPSIAVLPFRKDGADPQESYFADGIIEGIVHVLSGLERIVVVSRGSALALAETTVDPREVGRALGVRYALYGGVRRAGERLRITTELSETETGAIIRSDRYDGDAGDLFALQDRIAEQVVATIAPQVRERELARALRKAPESLTAYDLVLRALDRLKNLDRSSFAHGRDLLERAVALDPKYPSTHSYIAWWHMVSIGQGWSPDNHADMAEAERHAELATALDPQDPLAWAIRGHAQSYLYRNYDGALRILERAMALGPNCPWAWSFGSATAGYLGNGPEAVRLGEQAVRLAPLDPLSPLHEHLLSQAYYIAGRFEEAVTWANKVRSRSPGFTSNLRTLGAALVAVGRNIDAQEVAQRILAEDPSFRLSAFAARTPLPTSVRVLFVDRLRAAGLPD